MRKSNILLVLLLLVVAGCVSGPVEKAGESPQKGFDLHIDAKHFVKDARIPVHHWCKTINPQLIECLQFDSDNANANLVGIETIVTKDVWANFTEEQKGEWHDHATEIIEAEATLPDTPSEEAAKIVEFLKGTRGKVVYIWDFPKESYPVARPFLDSDQVTP